jgi:hypothetical protein
VFLAMDCSNDADFGYMDARPSSSHASSALVMPLHNAKEHANAMSRLRYLSRHSDVGKRRSAIDLGQ